MYNKGKNNSERIQKGLVNLKKTKIYKNHIKLIVFIYSFLDWSHKCDVTVNEDEGME